MATALESSPLRLARGLVAREAAGALVLAVALPFLFVHERYEPSASVAAGSTSVELRVSDVAILAVLAAASIAVWREGLSRLRAGVALWIPGCLLLLWLTVQVARPASVGDERFADHLVTFLKLGEYALLAPAVPLLVRSARDLTLVLGALVLWTVPASAVGLAQFLGLDVLDAWNRGWRQPSFLGHHDLAALAALTMSLAVASVIAGRARVPASRLVGVALAAGGLGLVLAGSVAAAGGFAVGALVAVLAARRRFAPSLRRLVGVAAIVAVVVAGVFMLRGTELGDFLRFVGLRSDEPPAGVETYSQRTVLAYIGLRIFADSPVAGVGWQRSSRPEVFEQYVDDARRRFPDVVELAFPAAGGREYGVQNLYVQMLADAGTIGLLLLLAVGGAGLLLALRATALAPTPWAAGAGLTVACALVALAGEWASMGIVAGIPLLAATCLVLGLAAAGAAAEEGAARDV